MTPAACLEGATLRYGGRTVWSDLTLELAASEFMAVIGPNGAGKTSLVRVLLGLQRLSAGRAEIGGEPVRRGSRAVGYVPQQKGFEPTSPLRARDLVGLGIDGHRWGIGLPSRGRRARVDAVLEHVGATAYADIPIGLLSGGEQQRLRIAQALVGEPALLICDEPLLSLDPAAQRAMSALIDTSRRVTRTAVLFVTHEIDPVIDMVDRILHLGGGTARVGTPEQARTSWDLSELYGFRHHHAPVTTQ